MCPHDEPRPRLRRLRAGLDLHLNSMLGEADLITGALEPGERMQSMMAPTLAFYGGEAVLAAGAAGGTRLRSALLEVLAGILDEELEPQDAVDRPRVHPAGTLVHLEPGFEPVTVAALESAGFEGPDLAGAAPLLRGRERRQRGPASRLILVGAGALEWCEARGEDPAHVAAVRAAGVRTDGAAVGRLRVRRSAGQAAHLSICRAGLSFFSSATQKEIPRWAETCGYEALRRVSGRCA